jgi:hypothetical protein
MYGYCAPPLHHHGTTSVRPFGTLALLAVTMLRVWGTGSSVTITVSVSSSCTAPRGLWASFATLKEQMTRRAEGETHPFVVLWCRVLLLCIL